MATQKKLKVGDIIIVYGQPCRIYRVYDFGTYDVETLDGERCPDGSFEAVGALFDHADSAVATTSVSLSYLRQKCKRISEAKARIIHPRLFDFLDM